MKNNKLKIVFLLNIIGILILINFVCAIGISKEYYDQNPAKIGPGETKDISFGLILVSQDEGNRNIELELIEGSEIATIISDKSFTALAGSRDNDVKLRVSVPQEASEGQQYTVTIRIKDLTPPSEGMVGFTQSTTSSIPILVKKEVAPEKPAVPEPAKASNLIIWIIVIVLVIAIFAIAYYFMKEKNGKNSGSKKKR